jgi:hypothetical protein
MYIEYFVLKVNLLFRSLGFSQWCCCILTSSGMLGEWLQTFRAVFVPPSSGPFSQDNSRSATHYHIAPSLMFCSFRSNAVVKQVSVAVRCSSVQFGSVRFSLPRNAFQVCTRIHFLFLRWGVNVARVGGIRNAYIILVWKQELLRLVWYLGVDVRIISTLVFQKFGISCGQDTAGSG